MITSRGIGRICNDLLPEEKSILSLEEWKELCKEYHSYNGDSDNYDEARPIMMDFMVVAIINHHLYKGI